MAKVITMTAYRRPTYTRQVLLGLARCSGVGDYVLLPAIDPGDHEVLRLLQRVDFCECRPLRHKQKQGCNRNTLLALRRGFDETDANFVVHMEDDMVPAVDFLRLMEHCDQTYALADEILSVAGYSREVVRREQYTDALTHRLRRSQLFCCYGFGTWRDRWEQTLQPNWIQTPKPMAWDTHVEQQIRQPRTMWCIYPSLSRIQNIGALQGAFNPGEKWHKTHVHLDVWAGNTMLPDGEFFEEPTG